ncbi:MAG: ABC transporter permease [Deltaproteobacteria bacterium]|jgi:rhamnose transport system permease protein|nr:ABC transporter permease [Deltaproteobacteria bacterium]
MSNDIKHFLRRNVREVATLAIILAIVVFVNARSGGAFLTPRNISDMFTESAILIIITMGMMMVIITTGIDLSIGAIMALSGMISTTVLSAHMSLDPMIIIGIAVAVGLVAGTINGALVAYLGILPIIATLGTMNVFRGLTYLVSGGSWNLQKNMSREFMNVAIGTKFGLNNMILIALVVVVAAHLFMNKYRAGRRIYAVGDSESSAAISGIKAKRVKLMAYAILGALSGLGGVLYVCKYAAAQGETAMGYEMNVIAACVLGGVAITGGSGKVIGAALGAILLGILNNALPLLRISPFWQEAIRGLIVLVSIIANVIISLNVTKRSLERRAL